MKKILVFIFLLLFAFTLTACSNDEIDNVTKDKDEEVIEDPTTELLQLTLEELSAYNGKDGNMAYIAVDGTIYDVTNEWNNGEHKGVMAGTDATTEITKAPHGIDILNDLEIVGELVE